nr:MAG TPA: hypothetical protein [Caudoviricetes sp.]
MLTEWTHHIFIYFDIFYLLHSFLHNKKQSISELF